MPDFAYVGLDTAGRERRGSVRAETSEAARDQLTKRRLYVVRIEPAAESTRWFRAACSSARSSTPSSHTLHRQLATLVTR